jgi:hypothetical protein
MFRMSKRGAAADHALEGCRRPRNTRLILSGIQLGRSSAARRLSSGRSSAPLENWQLIANQ